MPTQDFLPKDEGLYLYKKPPGNVHRNGKAFQFDQYLREITGSHVHQPVPLREMSTIKSLRRQLRKGAPKREARLSTPPLAHMMQKWESLHPHAPSPHAIPHPPSAHPGSTGTSLLPPLWEGAFPNTEAELGYSSMGETYQSGLSGARRRPSKGGSPRLAVRRRHLRQSGAQTAREAAPILPPGSP